MKAAATAELVRIEDLDHEGRGIARSDGKTVFVAGALPGEQVRITRRRRRRRHDEAVIVELLETSPDRVVPRCAHFGVCGGCALQHLAPAAQLASRQRQVAGALSRIGGVQPENWLPPLTGPEWAYRRRARLGCRWVPKKGRVLVGFRERESPLLADLTRCEILVEPVGSLLRPLAELVGRLAIRERVAQIEVAAGDEAVALVLRVLDEPGPGDLEQLRAFAAQWQIGFWLQPGGLDTVRPLAPDPAPLRYGLPALAHGIAFQPIDFIQVNAAVNVALVERAITLLAPGPGDHVLDLFCGLGNFSLPLALRAGRVTGVEGDAGLVARAGENAARNSLANAAFHVADLSRPDPDAAWARERHDLILLDPPRAGAREVLPIAAAGRPRRIAYISCHPGTLARDAGILVGQYGYRLVAAGVLDMFPHTAHVETIAVFEPC